MAEKSTKKTSESIIKMDIVALKVIGVIKYIVAGIYAIGFLAVIFTGKLPDVINAVTETTGISDNAASILAYVLMALIVALNIVLAVLCFRATKPGARPTALMVISMLLFLSTAFTYTGNIFDGSLDWSKFIPEIINLTAFGAALQIRRYNK